MDRPASRAALTHPMAWATRAVSIDSQVERSCSRYDVGYDTGKDIRIAHCILKLE